MSQMEKNKNELISSQLELQHLSIKSSGTGLFYHFSQGFFLCGTLTKNMNSLNNVNY